MAKLNAGNNSQTLLDGAITDTDTSMTVLDGSIFPDTPFAVTIEDEIIYVVAKSGNIFSSLLRGQEGTTAAAHATGVSVENRMTAGMYNALATQEEVDEHKADDTKHITSTERTIWNNKLDASAYTATDVLAKVKTVDGDGSGLDADLLDGAHAGNGPNNVLKLDSGGFVPLPNIPGTLTGKSADMVDGKHFSDIQNDAQAKVDTHANLTNNPHSVTKSQVGLGSVSNYGLATQAEAEAGTSSAKYMTPLRTKQAIDALQAVKSVAGKTGTVTLTKGDVGLSNVDNTSDMDKPISTATQTALANKVDNSRVLTDVPANAKFTDTTYSEITTSEIDAGTASTLRTITGRRVKYILDKVQGWIGGLTKSDVGLSNVDNVKQMPISDGVLENYREKLVTLSGTSTAINLSLGNVFTHTLTGNTTYSITNAVNNQAHSFTLIITQGGTVRTLTFPASVKWQCGEIPDLTTANKTYVLTFMTVDGGTNWLGMFGGEF